jgi:hypothetical protein
VQTGTAVNPYPQEQNPAIDVKQILVSLAVSSCLPPPGADPVETSATNNPWPPAELFDNGPHSSFLLRVLTENANFPGETSFYFFFRQRYWWTDRVGRHY